jgi:hypothetical protein
MGQGCPAAQCCKWPCSLSSRAVLQLLRLEVSIIVHRPGSPHTLDLRSARSRALRLWLISFLLFLPFYYPYLTHFLLAPPGALPTGFIQADQPYYMGNAREHFDDGGFHLFYGLPYSPFYGARRIYFQPQTLVLGVIQHFTRLDPGVVYILFGVVWGVICCRLALSLFEQLFGLRTVPQWLAAIGFVWGGGLLVALGTLRWLETGLLDDLFAYDPFGGMWFLNFGRNFIYPLEAYYHALWLGATTCLLRRRYLPALALVALTSASHPFTGVQLICVVLTWAGVERFWIRNREIPMTFVVGLAALLLLHVAYYRWFLNLWIEHRLVEEQWIRMARDWTYEARHFIPAYALVGLMTAWVLRVPRLAARVFSQPFARLLAVWALVSFALANHEFALRPSIQPLHFTRGYVWMPLYILGTPSLIAGLVWLRAHRSKVVAAVGSAAVMAVLFTDNAVFLTTYHWRKDTARHEMWIVPGFRGLVAFLNRPEYAGSTVITPPHPGYAYDDLPYLLLTYTPLRTWHSNAVNTPQSERRRAEVIDLFARGEFLPIWSTMRLLVILEGYDAEPPEWLRARNGQKVFANRRWVVYRLDPARAPSEGEAGSGGRPGADETEAAPPTHDSL